MAVVAVIFDYDDTLLPDSTSALLRAHDIDPHEFWTGRAAQLVARGYDPPLAYLNLLLREVGEGRPLGTLTNEKLRQFGATLDDKYFPGIPEVFDDLREQAAGFRDVEIEFYIISGGLKEVILGSRIVEENFDGVYGCEFAEHPETGVIHEVTRCITFTEKTRYLFEINKGISPDESATQPQLVNQDIALDERRIPFDRMIYVGDGLTDIPCFSLVGRNGGTAFGVFDPTKEMSARQAFQQFLRASRVVSAHRPRYGEEDELGAFLRAAVIQVCSRVIIERETTAKLRRY